MPAELRRELSRVPPADRDAWLDRLLGLAAPAPDGPELPRGGVPYLPCAVDALLRAVDLARVGPDDVFVDVGSGLGRACALVRLVTGAEVLGLEIQPQLVVAARALVARLRLESCSFIEGDAVEPRAELALGSVFFLYCPFTGARLEKLVDQLEPIARTRPIRLCAVDLPPLERAWLGLRAPASPDLSVYESLAR